MSLSFDGKPFEIGDLRGVFEIRDMVSQTPRNLFLRINNFSDATAQSIKARGVGWKVEVFVGYADGQRGRIFTGDVKQVRIGKDNPTDRHLDIFAADGDRAYNRAIVQKTLPANSTGRDVFQALAAPMGEFGVSPGFLFDALAKKRFPRPIVLFGMARDHMRTLAHSAGGAWGILNGRVNLVDKKQGMPTGGPITLNSRTGLVGLPEQTELGIIARVLINPQIDVHSLVHIDQRSIQEAAGSLALGKETTSGPNASPFIAPIASDGVYEVLALDHVGDTRGNPWYSTLYCQARGQGQTAAQVQALWAGDN